MRTLKRVADRLSSKSRLCDSRSRKVILVPHCALNQNARVAGAAEHPAAIVELIHDLLKRDIGILQMPCPELYAFGLDRTNVRVEKELRTPAGKALCQRLARELVQQIQIYLDSDFCVLGILGKNGSPSCGVEETWDHGICPGSGAFIEELAAELKEQRIAIEMAGIRDNEAPNAIFKVDRWLSIFKRS